MSIAVESTMFAALHGDLTPHPWREPSPASDAYSLFVARSSALGWLAEPTANDCGLWGMNDAGLDPAAGSGYSRAAWFQVSLIAPTPVDRPLPVPAFLACANAVTARVGALRLQAVQILLPVQNLALPEGASQRTGAVVRLLQETGWFADLPLRERTRVRVTLDGGQNASIRSVAPDMIEWLRELKQDVFDDFFLTDDDPVLLRPAITDELWSGPPLHRVTVDGTLAEWSLDSLGWLAALLAEAGRRHQLDSPLMLSATADT
ncbi:hypothetical protein ACIBK9_49895 [Nonomuraea sp. NPDC050227]|uniref:hypothetical protein n=1 Tax=Nonomuraea sp. NPDC050227 TaxID=3364360 RepID=UPI0037B6C7F1